jgi:hypothetical protein
MIQEYPNKRRYAEVLLPWSKLQKNTTIGTKLSILQEKTTRKHAFGWVFDDFAPIVVLFFAIYSLP